MAGPRWPAARRGEGCMSRHGCWPARGARRVLSAALGAVLVVTAQVAFATPSPVAAAASTQAGRPNRVGATAGAGSIDHLPPPPRAPAGPRPADGPLRIPSVAMRPQLVGLDPV